MNEFLSPYDAIRQQLLDEQQRLEQRLAANNMFGQAESLGRTTGELSTYDNHPADVATELFERSKDTALRRQGQQQLDQIQDALSRMARGQYGTCKTCGAAIPLERLQAVPETAYCAVHAPQTNWEGPAENAFLQHSASQIASPSPYNGWQIVANWGDSDLSMDEIHDPEEQDGYVEPFESFLATDMYGNGVSVMRNKQYKQYMEQNEGEPLLEPDNDSYS